MANLNYSELRKRPERASIFVRKLKEQSPFELKNGKKVKAKLEKGMEKLILTGTKLQVEKLLFTDGKGNTFKLSDVVKTIEFGGKGAGSGTAKEDAALEELRKQILQTKKTLGKADIPIKVGSKTYKVADVVSTPGTPKSDFHLVDINGKELVWISHKDGTTEKHFQQWGGMSLRVEPLIHNHPESQKFVEDMKRIYPKGIPTATTVARKIKNKKLKMMAIYGNEFGSEFGRQNTTLMLQGDVVLKKKGSYYEITAYHAHLNGEDMKGGYEPVFMAIYKGDRSDMGIKGARVVIAPIGCRKINEMV